MHTRDLPRERPLNIESPTHLVSDSDCALEINNTELDTFETSVKERILDAKDDNCIECNKIMEKDHFSIFNKRKFWNKDN